MKAHRLVTGILALSAFVLGGAERVLAQQPPASRADLSGTVGWLAINKEPPAEFDYSDDWQDSLFAAAAAGWYWSDHLKTELEFGAGTEARGFRTRQVVIEGRRTSEYVESQYSRKTLGLAQQYQFFRNAWFHPYVGGGVNVTFEETTDRISPIVIYDESAREPRVIRQAQVDGPRDDVLATAFVSTGFKAYLTQRGFFRTDLKVSLRDGVDEVLLRFGFGVDF